MCKEDLVKYCDMIVNRQYWLNGKLITRSCCMFLHTELGWYQLFFEDEQRKFVFEALKNAPKTSKILGDETLKYPHDELFSGTETLFELECGEVEASIKLSNGISIILNYDIQTESVDFNIYT